MKTYVSLVNFRSASAMLQMFGHLYSLGVEHAHHARSGDDIEAFVERVSRHGTYGLLTEHGTWDWQRWRSHLYFWSSELGEARSSRLIEYIRGADDLKTVSGCFYPISFRFYMQGVLDCLKFPLSESDFVNFSRIKGRRLHDFAKKGTKSRPMGRNGYIALVQTFAYELAEAESCDDVRPVDKCGAERYRKFSSVFWDVLESHRYYMRVQKLDEEIEKRKLDEIRRRITYGHDED